MIAQGVENPILAVDFFHSAESFDYKPIVAFVGVSLLIFAFNFIKPRTS